MSNTKFDYILTLEPISEEAMSESTSKADWLNNDDRRLLDAVDLSEGAELASTRDVTSLEPAQDSEKHELKSLCLKRSEFGFIVMTDEQERFLKDGDVIALPNAFFKAHIEQRALRESKTQLAKPEQTRFESDEDIWGMPIQSSLSAVPLDNVQPQMQANHSPSQFDETNNALHFLYEQPVHQQVSNLFDSTGSMGTRQEQRFDLQTAIPLTPIAPRDAIDSVPIVPDQYSPTPLVPMVSGNPASGLMPSGSSEQGNILRELGIDEHAAAMTALPNEQSVSKNTLQEQSPLDFADDYLRDDLNSEVASRSHAPRAGGYVEATPVYPGEPDQKSGSGVLGLFSSVKTKLLG
jgi:hypothetical protein